MIQRIQTLYMLLSAVLGVVCLSLPLGHFYTAQGEPYAQLYNLWVRLSETGTHQLAPWALFALLVGVTTLTLLGILFYRRRALQMRLLSFCMILLVGYYAWLLAFVFMYKLDGAFRPTLTAGLPLVSLILLYLAFRGVLKDEMLVRSLDRLR